MNKKDRILKHYDAWHRGDTTPKSIANRVGTTREYVMQVLNNKELEKELANREPVFYPDLTEDEIIEPDYGAIYVEPDIVHDVEYKEITLFPKVNQLGDGRAELIYESKMNY